MIRIFNHYLHRRTLTQVMLDLGLIVAVVLGIGLGPLGDSGGSLTLPLAASLRWPPGSSSSIRPPASTSTPTTARCASRWPAPPSAWPWACRWPG